LKRFGLKGLKMRYVILLTMLTACGYYEGPRGRPGKAGKDAPSCTVEQLADGAYMVCPDGTQAKVVSGSQGAQGQPGIVGADGKSVVGPKGDTGATGADGETVIGPQGIAGVDGQSVVGPAGAPGTPGTVITPVVPCPGQPYAEVLLCISEKLYAVFDSGQPGAVHYTEVIPGTYTTTQNAGNCSFTVVAGCEVQ
jgi:hypothetical protein